MVAPERSESVLEATGLTGTDDKSDTPKKKRLTPAEQDDLDFGHRIYDRNTPCPPAWEGTRHHDGVRITAGREYVVDALNEIRRWNDHDPVRHAIGSDIETLGAGPVSRWQIKSVAFASEEHAVVLDPRDPFQADLIRSMYGEPRLFVFHNCPFDVPILRLNDLMPDSTVDNILDTILMDRIARPSESARHSLRDVANHYLGLDVGDIRDTFKAAGFRSKDAGYKYSDIDMPAYLVGAGMDAIVTTRLYPKVMEAAVNRMAHSPFTNNAVDLNGAMDVLNRQHIVQRVMLRSNIHGFVINEDYYMDFKRNTEQEMAAKSAFLESLNLRPGNGDDLIRYLADEGELPQNWPRTPKGSLSASKDHMKKLLPKEHPVVSAHLFIKETEHNRKDYLDKMLSFAQFTGRVHPQVTCIGAITGRMSTGDPPVQQFSEDARPMIVADDPGGWVSIDYTAVEPVLCAYTAGQYDLVQKIITGGDAYIPVAEMAGLPLGTEEETEKSRKQAKQVFLGLLYGFGKASLASSLGMSIEEAEALKARVLQNIPKIGDWMRILRSTAEQTSLTMTAAGRVIQVGWDRENAKWRGYQAQNYYHQGSAYDLLCDALVEIKRQGLDSHVRLAIHDELVVTSEAAEAVMEIMANTADSLERFLAYKTAERIQHLGTDKFKFPVDANPLPDHWKKV